MKKHPMFKSSVSVMLCVLMCAFLMLPAAAAAPTWENKFTDVPAGIWYEKPLAYMNANGYINGVSETAFAPTGTTTRAMFVTILGRVRGINADAYKSRYSFSDPAADYFAGYIQWAAENNIVKGIGDNMFAPDANVTRQQVALIFYNYLNTNGGDTSAGGNIGVFSDASSVADYAKDAMVWAVGAKIIRGSDDGRLYPGNNASRAEIAQIFVNFLNFTGVDTSVTIGKEPAEPDTPDNPDNPDNPDVPDTPAKTAAGTLTVGNKEVYISMSVYDLLAEAGQPDEILTCIEDAKWYIFGTETYEDFFMAKIGDNRVVGLYGSGTGFTYMGRKMGDTNADFADTDTISVIAYTDSNDNDIIHGIFLSDNTFFAYNTYTADRLAGESKMTFHLLNAFRQYHGLNILKWSDKAAESARLHCVDMSINNYFDHYSLDGSSPGDRMAAQGLNLRGWGENIIAGYGGAINSNDGWINSAGHRSNMLVTWFTHLGCGYAYNQNSRYRIYGGENFYA